MIFQHFGLFPWKTVHANIEYGLSGKGDVAKTALSRACLILWA